MSNYVFFETNSSDEASDVAGVIIRPTQQLLDYFKKAASTAARLFASAEGDPKIRSLALDIPFDLCNEFLTVTDIDYDACQKIELGQFHSAYLLTDEQYKLIADDDSYKPDWRVDSPDLIFTDPETFYLRFYYKHSRGEEETAQAIPLSWAVW